MNVLMRTKVENLGKLKCRFGCNTPIGIYYMKGGCLCWPDPVQALCAQHAIQLVSDSDVVCIFDFTEFVKEIDDGSKLGE